MGAASRSPKPPVRVRAVKGSKRHAERRPRVELETKTLPSQARSRNTFDAILRVAADVLADKGPDDFNIQSAVLLPCGLSYTANLGTAQSDGFDLALQTLLTDHLRLDLSVGYADARYLENAYSPDGLLLAQKGDGVQALNFVNPPWDVSVAPNYSIPVGGDAKVQLRAQYIYHSRNNRSLITQNPVSPSYAPLDVADPPTHLANLRADYITGALDWGMYLNNAFNSHPLLGAYQDTPASNLVTHSTFRPRTLGVSLNYSF